MNDLVASIDERMNERMKYINDINDIVSQKLKRHEIVMLLGQSEMNLMKKQQEFQFSLIEDVLLDGHEKLTSIDSVVEKIRNKSTKH